MDIPGLLHSIKSSRGYENQIVHIEDIRKRQLEFANIELSPPIKNAFASTGIEKLYSHQASAIERIRSGENIVIVTSTASGKSLAYRNGFKGGRKLATSVEEMNFPFASKRNTFRLLSQGL